MPLSKNQVNNFISFVIAWGDSFVYGRPFSNSEREKLIYGLTDEGSGFIKAIKQLVKVFGPALNTLGKLPTVIQDKIVSYIVPEFVDIFSQHCTNPNTQPILDERFLMDILQSLSEKIATKNSIENRQRDILFANIISRLRSNADVCDTPCRILSQNNRASFNETLYKQNFLKAYDALKTKRMERNLPEALNLIERKGIYDRAENLDSEAHGVKYNAFGTDHFKKVFCL